MSRDTRTVTLWKVVAVAGAGMSHGGTGGRNDAVKAVSPRGVSMQKITAPSGETMFLRLLGEQELVADGVGLTTVVREQQPAALAAIGAVAEAAAAGAAGPASLPQHSPVLLSRIGLLRQCLRDADLAASPATGSAPAAPTESGDARGGDGVDGGDGAASQPVPDGVLGEELVRRIGAAIASVAAALDAGDHLAALQHCAARDALLQLAAMANLGQRMLQCHFRVHVLQSREAAMGLSMTRKDVEAYLDDVMMSQRQASSGST